MFREVLQLRTDLAASSSPVGVEVDQVHPFRFEELLDLQFGSGGRAIGILDAAAIRWVLFAAASTDQKCCGKDEQKSSHEVHEPQFTTEA